MNNTSINWTDFSSNLIRARRLDNGKTGHFCTHKNDKCRNCYAEAINMRFGTGLKYLPANRDKIEFFFAENEADNLRKKNKSLAKQGKTAKVFLSSMTDLFHETMPFELIDRVYDLISECKNLTFQTLTKRADIALKWIDSRKICQLPENNWFGLTPEDNGSDIPTFLLIPTKVAWLSLEPLLKPLDLIYYLSKCESCNQTPALNWRFNGETWEHYHGYPVGHINSIVQKSIHWIVIGGESGQKARETNLDLFRHIVLQNKFIEAAIWIKQTGAKPFQTIKGEKQYLKIKSKGESFEDLPTDLQIREMPEIKL